MDRPRNRIVPVVDAYGVAEDGESPYRAGDDAPDVDSNHRVGEDHRYATRQGPRRRSAAGAGAL